jgi:hypothetical protein
MNTPDNDPDELDAELRAIVRAAAELPALSPSRDLWSGIAARIEAPIVALPTRIANATAVVAEAPAARVEAPPARLPWRRLAVAASLLVATTAGVTYSIVKHRGAAEIAGAGGSATVVAPLASVPVEPASTMSAEQTFDREIGAMRNIIDERRKELDPVTISVLQKNLKVIDAAIAESKAALAKDPASAFLMDRLTQAYDTKLQLLRGVASIPAHG